MTSPHASAFNLARRMSVKNEPDLLQEDMNESSTLTQTTPPSSPYNRRICFEMLDKVCPPDSPLPKDCTAYPDVLVALQRKNSNPANHSIAFAGMSHAEAAAAKAARERGRLNHAQIQRRMTSGQTNRIW